MDRVQERVESVAKGGSPRRVWAVVALVVVLAALLLWYLPGLSRRDRLNPDEPFVSLDARQRALREVASWGDIGNPGVPLVVADSIMFGAVKCDVLLMGFYGSEWKTMTLTTTNLRQNFALTYKLKHNEVQDVDFTWLVRP